FDYPLTGSNLLRNLPPTVAVLCFFDFLLTWVRGRIAPRIDDSFETWVVNRFGRRLYDIYFGPYTAKVWGSDPTQLSSSWAAQRVAVVDLWDLIKHTLGINSRPPDEFEHSPYLIDFHYPRRGIGSISERLAEEIRAHGGRIHLNSRVVAVEHSEGRARSVVYLHEGELHRLPADYVVSSIPINDLVRGMQPVAPTAVLDAADRLKYRAMVFLYIMLDKPAVTDDHWIYFPAPEDIFNRVSEMRNFSEDTVPEGQTSLCVEITCDQGDRLWTASNSELFERSVYGLEQAGLIRREEILGYFTRRMTNAYPTYDLDFEEKLNRLTGYLHNFENLLTIGRQGLFRYFNMDHAMETGYQAAEKIMSGALREKVIRVGQEQVWFG
ncbi:MAG: FAD-dependent oxidoreductase, partial [Anaerolineae bacterium]|nr:FAD-dependent oxidoreductase [Anaerolineae bacterium]